MKQLDSQFKQLVRFAFIPQFAIIHSNLSLPQDDIINYLCFSFERNSLEKAVLEKENFAIFNTGLIDTNSKTVFAYFELNQNPRQKWCLKQLASMDKLPVQVEDSFGKPICNLYDYNLDLYSFAFCHDDKFRELAAKFFNNDLLSAKRYIEKLFKNAHKLGFMVEENAQAVMNIGLGDAYKPLYALFKLNIKSDPKWFLAGFFADIKGISSFPECAPTDDLTIKNIESLQKNNKTTRLINKESNPGNITLLVTALGVEYNALAEVLQDEDIDYTEDKTTEIGNRELNYMYIQRLNTYAILAGQSFECIIPIIQSFLAFKPYQAILSGIAFSFDMKKAPFNSIVVSNHVWDYETAKINEETTRHRGSKLPSGANLRHMYTEKLAKGVVVKNGDYASGMKVVNSLAFQDKIKEFEAEILAGDQEGFFFAHSCNEFKLDWIVIKAISDYGVGKADDIQKTAAYAALSYVVKGLLNQK